MRDFTLKFSYIRAVWVHECIVCRLLTIFFQEKTDLSLIEYWFHDFLLKFQQASFRISIFTILPLPANRPYSEAIMHCIKLPLIILSGMFGLVCSQTWIKGTMKAKTLSPELLQKMDACWRATNYLSVGQVYLFLATCSVWRGHPCFFHFFPCSPHRF